MNQSSPPGHCHMGARAILYRTGGYGKPAGSVVYTNDVWYSVTGGVWTQRSCSPCFPARASHSMVAMHSFWGKTNHFRS